MNFLTKFSLEAKQYRDEVKKIKSQLAEAENSLKILKTEQKEQLESATNKVREQTSLLMESGKAAENLKAMEQQIDSKNKEIEELMEKIDVVSFHRCRYVQPNFSWNFAENSQMTYDKRSMKREMSAMEAKLAHAQRREAAKTQQSVDSGKNVDSVQSVDKSETKSVHVEVKTVQKPVDKVILSPTPAPAPRRVDTIVDTVHKPTVEAVQASRASAVKRSVEPAPTVDQSTDSKRQKKLENPLPPASNSAPPASTPTEVKPEVKVEVKPEVKKFANPFEKAKMKSTTTTTTTIEAKKPIPRSERKENPEDCKQQ